jgi:hypothetical protein
VTPARILIGVAAAILALGGAMHALAFPKTAAAVAGSNLPPFFGNALKALWLMDSCGMFALSAICVVLIAQPQSASPLVVALLSLIPFSTAVLLYVFLGNFFAAHMLIAAAFCLSMSAVQM